MTVITVHDEATRRVLESASWYAVRKILDPMDMTELGATINDMEDAAVGYDRRPGGYEALLGELDAAIEGLVALRSQVADVRAAAAGDRVDILGPEDVLRDAVAGVKEQIEEYGPDYDDGGLLAQPPDVRETLLGSRDAAARLLDELPVEAVA